MQPEDDRLVQEAARFHSASVREHLRAGGQKLVAVVTTDDSVAVLKVVRIQGEATDADLKRAHREAELLARISHPNLVKGKSTAHEHGNPPYAISWLEEYLDGSDLRDIVGEPWAWNDTLQMAKDVASALAELHKNKVVHRDLSAGNIRRVSTGVFKVLDPGLAKHLDLSGVTGVHQPGTPGFLSPEHVQIGASPSYASDIFSFGILLWLCLTGNLPLSPRDPVVYASQLGGGQVGSIQKLRSDISHGAAAMIDRCMQRQIARRYFDGVELRAALEEL